MSVARAHPGVRLHRDRRGQLTVEWALVMIVLALPTHFIFKLLLRVMVAHYQMVTLMHAAPFP